VAFSHVAIFHVGKFRDTVSRGLSQGELENSHVGNSHVMDRRPPANPAGDHTPFTRPYSRLDLTRSPLFDHPPPKKIGAAELIYIFIYWFIDVVILRILLVVFVVLVTATVLAYELFKNITVSDWIKLAEVSLAEQLFACR